MALEDDYRAYRGVISAAIRVLRPHVKAEPVGFDALAQEIERFSPQLVICTWPNTVDPGGIPAWVELSVDHRQPTGVCVGGHYMEHPGPLALEGLMEIVDDIERLTRAQSDRKGC